jgi:hypothetical protein
MSDTFNVPGRLIDFYRGGGAWVDYSNFLRNKMTPSPTFDLGADELALFNAVEVGKIIRPSKGGYFVKIRLTSEIKDALRYWAQTLETASQDNASEGEPDAKLDLRAATKVLERL